MEEAKLSEEGVITYEENSTLVSKLESYLRWELPLIAE